MINTTTFMKCFCFIFVTLNLLSCAANKLEDPCQENSTSSEVIAALQSPEDVGELNLLLKMDDLENQLPSFQQAIAVAHSQMPMMEKFRISQVSHDIISLKLPGGSPAKAVVESFIQQGKILYAEPNYKTFSTEINESENFDEPSHLIETTAMGPSSGQEVIVAIVDSGVDYTHKDLAPYMWHNSGEIPNNKIDDDRNGYVDDYYGYDFANNDNDPMADDKRSYHGTHVAGIVKAATQLSRKNINLKIMAIKYLDASGSGWTANAIKALDYAIKNGAVIINNSWGSMHYSKALSETIERSRRARMLFVAASGNGDAAGNGINIDRTPFYPAGYSHDNIISVAAAGQGTVLTRWSNYGRTKVDLAAPGLKIRSTRNGNTYAVLSGTSMASPYVAGIAAILRGLRPDLSYQEIRTLLFKSVTSAPILWGKVATSGRINPSRAMELATTYSYNPKEMQTSKSISSPMCYR